MRVYIHIYVYNIHNTGTTKNERAQEHEHRKLPPGEEGCLVQFEKSCLEILTQPQRLLITKTVKP